MKQKNNYMEMDNALQRAMVCEAEPDAVLVQRVKFSTLRGEPAILLKRRRVRALAIALVLALLFCACTATLAATGTLDELSETIREKLRGMTTYEYDKNRLLKKATEYLPDGTEYISYQDGVHQYRIYNPDVRARANEETRFVEHTFAEGEEHRVYDAFGNEVFYERSYYQDDLLYRTTVETEYTEIDGAVYRLNTEKTTYYDAEGKVESWGLVYWNEAFVPHLQYQYRGDNSLAGTVEYAEDSKIVIRREYGMDGETVTSWTVDAYEDESYERLLKSTVYNANGTVNHYSIFTYAEFPLEEGFTEWREVKQMVYHGDGSLMHGFETKHEPIENYLWCILADGTEIYGVLYKPAETIFCGNDGKTIRTLYKYDDAGNLLREIVIDG